MSINDTQELVYMAIADRQGYSAGQVQNTMTLGDLMAALEEAIEDFGADARIIVDNGDRYGARFGGVDSYRDLFTAPEADDEDDEF